MPLLQNGRSKSILTNREAPAPLAPGPGPPGPPPHARTRPERMRMRAPASPILVLAAFGAGRLVSFRLVGFLVR